MLYILKTDIKGWNEVVDYSFIGTFMSSIGICGTQKTYTHMNICVYTYEYMHIHMIIEKLTVCKW